jgi:hypothetical protein
VNGERLALRCGLGSTSIRVLALCSVLYFRFRCQSIHGLYPLSICHIAETVDHALVALCILWGWKGAEFLSGRAYMQVAQS